MPAFVPQPCQLIDLSLLRISHIHYIILTLEASAEKHGSQPQRCEGPDHAPRLQ
jgi:hypothetical protein